MNALYSLALVLSSATVVGWVVNFVLNRWLSNPRARVVWAIVVTLIVMTVAFSHLAGQELPPADAAQFSDEANLEMVFSTGPDADAKRISKISVSFRPAIKVDEDSFADLRIAPVAARTGSPEKAVLSVGKQTIVRTTQPCDMAGAAESSSDAATTRICARDANGAGVYRWILRAEKPGLSLATLSLPPDVLAQITASPKWSATVSVNGERQGTLGQAKEAPPVVVPRYRSDLTTPSWGGSRPPTPRQLDPNRLFAGPFDVDIESGEITFHVQFDTTLGVTAAVYDMLTKIGTILSAALGGGWLWQAFAWRKQKQTENDEEAKRIKDEQAQKRPMRRRPK
jgi:hypothetical protein